MERLSNTTGEWLSGEKEHDSIIISTRIRFARNLANYPFLTNANTRVKESIYFYIIDTLTEHSFLDKYFLLDMDNLTPIDRMFLVERHLISMELAQGDGKRGVIIDNKECISIMINEEDHIRMQIIKGGLDPYGCFEEINKIDDEFEEYFEWAFDRKFGYLTVCPTNIGTGMRVSVMMHLPALTMSGRIQRVIESISRIGFTIRGIFGEGSKALGNFFQISNQVVLGVEEKTLLDDLTQIISDILRREKAQREILLKENRVKLEDKIYRDVAVLKNARILSTQEALSCLSSLRMAVQMGIIEGIDLKTINEIFLFCQPAHLQKRNGKALEEEQRDILRATFIRERLKTINL